MQDTQERGRVQMGANKLNSAQSPEGYQSFGPLILISDRLSSGENQSEPLLTQKANLY